MASTDARRLAILEALRDSKTIRVADLSRQFGVSEVSIRRDLAKLEQYGLLRRVHGGAIGNPTVPPNHSFDERLRRRAEEKRRIGKAAAALVQPGDSIILDSGTTVLQVAREIAARSEQPEQFTVITSSLPAFRELAGSRNLSLIILGGVFLPDYQTLVGPQTLANLSALHADKLFLGSDGLSFSHGVTTRSLLEAEVSKAMVRAATEIIVVCDSKKIGTVGFTSVVPLSQVHRLVTDTEAPEPFVNELRSVGVEVILA